MLVCLDGISLSATGLAVCRRRVEKTKAKMLKKEMFDVVSR
jgi:ribosomal protein S3AE